VYSKAGARLLNRPLPEDYQRQWTEHLRQRKAVPGKANISAMVFRLGKEWFALPTKTVIEALESRPIHTLPRRRAGLLLGVVNVRGELWLCVSPGHLLAAEGTPEPGSLRTSCRLLLAVQWEGVRFVFPVEEVLGTCRFDEDGLLPARARPGRAFVEGCFSWRERAVGWLDASRLFAALNGSLA
jgi:chemotaxis-related protein WspD